MVLSEFCRDRTLIRLAISSNCDGYNRLASILARNLSTTQMYTYLMYTSIDIGNHPFVRHAGRNAFDDRVVATTHPCFYAFVSTPRRAHFLGVTSGYVQVE